MERVRNWFKQFKNVISISMTKNATSYSYGRRQIAERWKKVMKNLDGKYFD